MPVPVCGSTKMERFPQISSVLERNVVIGYECFAGKDINCSGVGIFQHGVYYRIV